MKFWESLILFVAGLALALGIAAFQPAPGYMDADYYYAGGMQLAAGGRLDEPFLWNYLDDPAGLPHPAFAYWMPLASVVAALGMLLTGEFDFGSARLGFFFLAAWIPVVTAWLAYGQSKRRVTAWTAGGLALFSGYYAVYTGLTETFTLYMLLGTAFLAAASQLGAGARKALLLGAVAGLLHLTRADGLLWLVLALWVIALQIGRGPEPGQPWQARAGHCALVLLAYGLVMSGWYGRNLLVFGGLFPPGNSRTLWVLEYDQLFSFPAGSLTFSNWWSAGVGYLTQQRWEALVSNAQNVLAVQGNIFLLPLILAGLVRLRRDVTIQLAGAMWLVTLGVMTLVFPLAGARGGFLHSEAAFQPLLWGVAAEGLIGFIGLGVRFRNWKLERAAVGFGILAVLIAAVVTLGLTMVRLLGDASGDWAISWRQYAQMDQALDRMQVPPQTVVVVNNPPGFFVSTGRSAIVIPNGDLDTVLAVAKKYHAEYLILEENTVQALAPIYRIPGDRPGLKYLERVDALDLYQIISP